MFRGIFVTGTDTNVGKTVVSSALMLRYREEANLRNTDILGLVHHRKFKWRMCDFSKLHSHTAEQIRVGDQTARLERGSNAL